MQQALLVRKQVFLVCVCVSEWVCLKIISIERFIGAIKKTTVVGEVLMLFFYILLYIFAKLFLNTKVMEKWQENWAKFLYFIRFYLNFNVRFLIAIQNNLIRTLSDSHRVILCSKLFCGCSLLQEFNNFVVYY